MAVALSPVSLQVFFDDLGNLIRPSKLFFYLPNTLDPVTVYKDENLSVPYPQPLTTGGSGRVPPVYVGEQDYRVRIFKPDNSLIEDIPFLPGAATDAGGGGGTPAADTAIETGDVIWRFSGGATRTGWVRANGRTIGSATSLATERANDDAQALFVWLWGQDTGNQLTVSSGKGASASADWFANKTLTLPDFRGSMPLGMDTMGNTARGFFSGVTFSGTGGGAAVPGSFGGAMRATIGTTNLPAHNHSVIDPGHLHTATQAAHTHTINDAGHTHSLRDGGHTHPLFDPGHFHAVNDPGHDHDVLWVANAGSASSFARGSTPGANSGGAAVFSNTTGLSVAASLTGISVFGSVSNLLVNNNATGITVNPATPTITLVNATTGITTALTGSGNALTTVSPFVLGTWYMKL